MEQFLTGKIHCENRCPERFVQWSLLFYYLAVGTSSYEFALQMRCSRRTNHKNKLNFTNAVYICQQTRCNITPKDRLPSVVTSICMYSFICSCETSFIAAARLATRVQKHRLHWLAHGQHKNITIVILVFNNHRVNPTDALKLIHRVFMKATKQAMKRILAAAHKHSFIDNGFVYTKTVRAKSIATVDEFYKSHCDA